MADLNDINSSEWQIALSGQDTNIVQGIKDIEQCIRIILTTQRGSVPHQPNFGVDSVSWLGLDIANAIATLSEEIQTQIEEFEPRANIENITYELSGQGSSIITFIINWTSSLGVGTNIVDYGASS